MEDLQNGAEGETQRNDLEVEGEEVIIDAVEDVKPEVEEVSIDEKDLSFDDTGSTREEEANEKGPQIENLEEAKEVSELVLEAVEPVHSLPEAVTSNDGEDENNGSPTVAAEVEQRSSPSMDLPETGSVLPLVEVIFEEFQESTLSNADENSQSAPVKRDVDLEGTDETQENAENSELVANENVPQVNGNHTAAETPKTTANPPVISVTKRTSFLGCCGFFEVLRRSDR